MELFFAIIAGILGWQHGTLGAREVKAIAIVVAGWTAVTTAASVPYLTLESFLRSLQMNTSMIFSSGSSIPP